MTKNIDQILQRFHRFGVHLGLERIHNLLQNLNNPHHQFPIIHVGGTNGKGSVCTYLSSILTEAGYKVGRYTSPHLISWNERICINQQPIDTKIFTDLLLEITKVIDTEKECPTQFEIITAAAYLYFAKCQVDIAIIEVGLGGKLDATNVFEKPLISVITSISKEHWQTLGSTLTEIAEQKAGIIKNNCPVVIGKVPLEAQKVFEQKINELNCSAYWVKEAEVIKEDNSQEKLVVFNNIEYPLKLLGKIQLINSAIAIQCIEILRKKGWQISLNTIQNGMKKTKWAGRIEWLKWQNYDLLIDGAHNPEAAEKLREYIDTLNKPIIWIMGMLSTKDHEDIFKNLLRKSDELYLIPVPDHSTAQPEDLKKIALNICPELSQIYTDKNVFSALNKATLNNINNDKILVLCGSLYLLGYFLANK